MSSINIPEEMCAVVLDSFSGAEALRVEKRPVTRPGKNEVPVKMEGSTIHPADIELINGQYGYFDDFHPPFVAGVSGCGTVVEAGSGLMARYLKGKRVQCASKILYQETGDGAWAEYMLTSADYALPLNKAIDFEQAAAGSALNVLSAIGLIEFATEGGHKAIIQTAAAGTVGQMVYRLAQQEGIEVVNVVRRDAQVELLKKQGAAIVLNHRDPDFDQALNDVCHQYQVHLAFDAVGGPLTRQLVQAMPERSTVVIYGLLAGEPLRADMKQLVFQQKSIDAFFLISWLDNKNMIQNLRLWSRVQKLVADGLTTEIRGQCPLQDAKQAVEAYQHQMTGGKMLLIPDG